MKVRDLTTKLANLNPELDVIMSKDPEGNRFYSLDEVESAYAYPNDWEWEFVHPDDVAEYEGNELTEVVVLWP